MNDPIKVNAEAPINPDTAGCRSLAGYITTSYAKLEAAFGPPTRGPEGSGDGKVSTEWVFLFRNDVQVTIYDYKETDAYDSSLPAVEEFRARPEYKWHISAPDGSTLTAAALRYWLEGVL